MTSAHSVHPLRFGVEMMAPFEGRTWADSARELEAMGYSTLFAPDHLNEGYGPITAMATAAAATTTLKVATAVFAVDFRHPAILARELASIDQLSGGRLEVGLGAGYMVDDYATSGIRMDSPRIRVDRLMEYVAVLRGLFGDGSFTFEGEHYRVTGLDGSPAPHTPGGPPILVAGGGRRMLTFAAQQADIVGVNPSLPTSAQAERSALDALPARIDTKFEWIREAAGERLADLEIHAWLRHAHVTNDVPGTVAPLARSLGGAVEDVLGSPIVLIGSVGEIIERLHERRERWGYSYYTLQQPVAREFAAVVARLSS